IASRPIEDLAAIDPFIATPVTPEAPSKTEPAKAKVKVVAEDKTPAEHLAQAGGPSGLGAGHQAGLADDKLAKPKLGKIEESSSTATFDPVKAKDDPARPSCIRWSGPPA